MYKSGHNFAKLKSDRAKQHLFTGLVSSKRPTTKIHDNIVNNDKYQSDQNFAKLTSVIVSSICFTASNMKILPVLFGKLLIYVAAVEE